MTEFKIWEKNLCFENEIKMKHLRKLMPLVQNLQEKKITEIDLVIEASKIFFISMDWENNLEKFSETMENFSLPETTQFSEKIWEIISEAVKPEKKK